MANIAEQYDPDSLKRMKPPDKLDEASARYLDWVNGTTKPKFELTEKEQRASDAILAAKEAIEQMDDTSPLTANNHELYAAIHVLQGFTKQHVLHRLDPDQWSQWWGV